jgi:plastocyanin
VRGAAGKRTTALGLIAGVSLALSPAASVAGKNDDPKPINGPTVKVADDFFSPVDVKVKQNTKVKFKWDPANGNQHNVTLAKGPAGVKKKDFTSGTGAIGIKFNPVFEKRGTYDLLCTLHATVMKMKVTVKK